MVVRRLLIALAVLVGLTALAAGVAPRPEDPDRSAEAPLATGTPPEPVEATISTAGDERRVVAKVGQPVKITVRGDEVDSVTLGELDVAPIDPESPAIFELLAEDPGTYPIALLDAERRLGELVIEE